MTEHDPSHADAKRLLMGVLAARHDPDEVQNLLQRYVEDSEHPADAIFGLALTTMGVTQIAHQLCHLSPNIDRMVETMIAGGPSALNAHFTESLDAEELLSEKYTRKVFDDFTEDTNQADRLWSVVTMPNGQKAITLEGSGFPKRVFAPIGASDEDIQKFRDVMVQYERDLK